MKSSFRSSFLFLFFLFLLLLLVAVVPAKPNPSQRHHHQSHSNHHQLVTTDYLMHLQCRAKCFSESHSHECDFEKCLRELRSSKKPGSCPRRREVHLNDTRINALDNSCVDQCRSWDFNCPVEERCCPNSFNCGSSCHRPVDLDRIKDLPPVPVTLSVMESRRNIEICWDVYTEIKNKTLFFVIEGRWMVGTVFAAHKLSDWSVFHGHPRYDHVLRLSESKREIARRWCFILKRIKPGRYYQFRVASVNAHGSRGFSRHSTEVQLRDLKGNRFPKPPRDLSVGNLRSDRHNSSLLMATLTWNQQRTHIPVDKFKIFWSRNLPGPGDFNSVSTQHATVLEPQRHFELRHLLPESTYFVQVQSIAVFGQKRLRSKKISITLNTTAEMLPVSHLQVRHLTKSSGGGSAGLRVRYVVSKATNGLGVKVHWQNNSGNLKHFQLELCPGTTKCLDKVALGGEYRSVNTNRSSFEFLDLGFGRTYSLRLKSFAGGEEPKLTAYRTFVTPECHVLKQKASLRGNVDCR